MKPQLGWVVGEMRDLGRQASGPEGVAAAPFPPRSVQFSRILLEESGRVGKGQDPFH